MPRTPSETGNAVAVTDRGARATRAVTHVGVQLSHERAEVVVLKVLGQDLRGELVHVVNREVFSAVRP